jgi:hypothetical protein
MSRDKPWEGSRSGAAGKQEEPDPWKRYLVAHVVAATALAGEVEVVQEGDAHLGAPRRVAANVLPVQILHLLAARILAAALLLEAEHLDLSRRVGLRFRV